MAAVRAVASAAAVNNEYQSPTIPSFMLHDENAFQFFRRIRRGRLYTGIRIIDEQVATNNFLYLKNMNAFLFSA